MRQFLGLLSILLLIFAIGAACTTAKNTGEAIKEGSTEAAEEVGDKAEDAGEAVGDAAEGVGDKAEDLGEATVDTAQRAGQEVEDGSITAAIKARFANDELVSASNIDVDTNNGMVTLNGTVASQAEADRAMQLAQTVEGVKNVTSNLVISNQ